MSLAIRLECPHCHEGPDYGWSPTYNLRPMWTEAGLSFEAIEGKPLENAGPSLMSAIARLEAEPERYKAMEPANRWGTYDDLMRLLRDMLDVARGPRGKLHVRLSP